MRRLCLVVTLLLCVLTVSLAQPAGTSCPSTRRRKSWDSYDANEKARYLAAVQLAMKQGYHQKFVELHTEYWSEREAHQTCVFIYWHRMFLLGYENMLRSLDDDFKCVTLPYWDHLSATARRASQKCYSLESCAPIVQDFGGSTTGTDTYLLIYDTLVPDDDTTKCITAPLFSNFCANNTQCARCVLRGPASATPYPAEAYFASVAQQLFRYSSWQLVTTSIERGIHNTVHGAAGGIMNWFQSPIDPLFYAHHALIDLLQTIHFKCKNRGEILLSRSKKGSDSRFWTNCARRTSGKFQPSDVITMNTRDFSGLKWVSVRSNPNNILYAFFKDLPGSYVDYVDAKDLGSYSYPYELQGGLVTFYSACEASMTMKAAVLLDDSALDATEESEDAASKCPRPVLKGCSESDKKTRHWSIAIYEAARIVGYEPDAAREQMELILCTLKQECYGGVADYDETFRKNFVVTGRPRCYALLQLVENDQLMIGVPGWRKISNRVPAVPVSRVHCQRCSLVRRGRTVHRHVFTQSPSHLLVPVPHFRSTAPTLMNSSACFCSTLSA